MRAYFIVATVTVRVFSDTTRYRFTYQHSTRSIMLWALLSDFSTYICMFIINHVTVCWVLRGFSILDMHDMCVVYIVSRANTIYIFFRVFSSVVWAANLFMSREILLNLAVIKAFLFLLLLLFDTSICTLFICLFYCLVSSIIFELFIFNFFLNFKVFGSWSMWWIYCVFSVCLLII